MKELKLIRIIPIIILGIMMLTVGCKKDEDKGKAPVLETSNVSDITESTVSCGGSITSDGGKNITAKGVCWSAGRTPTIDDNHTSDGTGAGSFTCSLTGLVKNTKYYVRAYATNSAGTSYGNPISFTTLRGSGTVTDFDGNVYDTLKIGNQVWMKQNLRVTHYRNGDTIQNLSDNTQWCTFTTGGFCNFKNDVNNVPVYGRLYNWYAVNDSRNIAPAGWHVATDAEWTELISYLGGESVVGGKLKEAGISHWASPNTGGANEGGFTALPAGTRFGQYGIPGYGTFSNMGKTTEWWTANEQCSRGIGYDRTDVIHSIDSRRSDGFSVRCIKNSK